MRKLLYLMSLIPIQILLYKLLARSDFFINTIYISFYKAYQFIVGGITNSIPFSVGDCLYFIIALIIIVQLFSWLRKLFRKEFKKLKIQTEKILKYINVGVGIYYLLWGFMYYYKNFNSITDNENIDVNELKLLADRYFKKCVQLRETLPENADSVMLFNLSDAQFSNELTTAYPLVPEQYKKLNSVYSTRIKKSLYSKILVYFGIGGYFNPFTQECQYIYLVSDYKKPIIMAHEFSHKLGYAKENEANFGAFLLSDISNNSSFQYSTHFSALRHVLYDIYPQDSMFVRSVQRQYSPGMKRDRYADSLLQIRYGSEALERSFHTLNNTFLRMNEQEGIVSYHKYVKLLLNYEKQKHKNEFN